MDLEKILNKNSKDEEESSDKMNTCYFCKEKYEGYLVLTCDKIECLALEQHIKDIYYSEGIGVCPECRDKEFYKNKIWMWKSSLSVEIMLRSALTNIKDSKIKKTYEEAIARVKKKDKELEKLPEIRSEIMKNDPASLKDLLKEKKECDYCGKNYGQKWINDPNQKVPTIDKCRWVCTPCEKIINLEEQSAFLSVMKHKFKEEGFLKPEIEGKINRDIKKIDQQIQDIAYKEGQEVCCVEIKKEGNSYKVKRKDLGKSKEISMYG